MYSGPGTFILSFYDANRNAGVVNIPGSVNQVFAVQTMITVEPTAGNSNCSVRFTNSPIQDACEDEIWIHNPAAYDPDGDSLSYEPVVCLGADGDGNIIPIENYSFPGPNYSIDPVTGTITWNAPNLQAVYNIAFKVTEWRRNIWGIMQVVGWVIRDMQITVVACDNEPPVVQQMEDTCVVAGTLLSFNVSASDPDAGQSVTLTALGQPFLMGTSPATFVQPSPGNPVNGIFTWNTACAHVRVQPYQVVFSAADNGQPVNLQDYKTMTIRIVAPAPEDPQAEANASQIDLSWEQSICSNATGYRIYRRTGFYGFEPDHCETGVPAYTGYSFLTEVEGVTNTSHSDQQNLVFGQQYCYMVTAVFPDGAESYASEEFCALLDRQLPIMTNVTVDTTDPSAGEITVRWTNALDLDTAAHPGPYKFLLYRGEGFNGANDLIWESGLHPFIDHPDTFFNDAGLNTQDQAYVYRVELLGAEGNDTIGSANEASSVFITATPNDEQITISWEHNVPWTNYLYEVYRENSLGEWDLIGTDSTMSYVDTGLVNGEEYCYYVRSVGEYADTTIASPLYNLSQRTCTSPVDLTPPCPPQVELDNDCELPLNSLSWTNTDTACPDTDDTFGYHIYFTDSLGGQMTRIATITAAGETIFSHTDGQSVAGCYTVTAVDLLGNESAPSNTVCGDNCPIYELPNIFTPNGDDQNDLFGPFPYRGVKEIQLEIFNRWGHLVFETTDPEIEWPGTYLESSEPVPDGVYFYVCTVLQQRLSGVEPVVLKGYVHIVGSGAPKKVP
jgi:gliding motility-associated-like protein